MAEMTTDQGRIADLNGGMNAGAPPARDRMVLPTSLKPGGLNAARADESRGGGRLTAIGLEGQRSQCKVLLKMELLIVLPLDALGVLDGGARLSVAVVVS